MSKKLEDYVRTIVDFPKEGINFRDITTVMLDADALKMAIDGVEELLKDVDFDLVVAPEARGYLFGPAIAYNMHKGFVLIRKKGKLPAETVEQSYDLEYGSATIEMHKDAIQPGAKVVIIDDLFATGGTTKAMIDLVEKVGGKVEKIVCVMELCGLNGRKEIEGYDFDSVIKYPDA